VARFRKKPVVIDAIQWDGEESTFDKIIELDADQSHTLGMVGAVLCIPTLEGVMEASPGDWIIRGVKGELYPCKPDIFDATYDPA
jgi:hypothetical protein